MSTNKRHESLERLLFAAEKLGVKGPSMLARSLNVSEQVVTNWRYRGVSNSGAVEAQRTFGISSNWILKGEEPMMLKELVTGTLKLTLPSFMPRLTVSNPPIAQAVEVLSSAIGAIPSNARTELAPLLQALIVAPDSKELCSRIVGLLSAPDQEQQPKT